MAEPTTEPKTSGDPQNNVVNNDPIIENFKTDMLKYKSQRNELRTEVEEMKSKLQAIEDEKKKVAEEQMVKNQEFQALAETRAQELEKVKADFQQKQIESDLKVKALSLGIQNADDVALVDKSLINILSLFSTMRILCSNRFLFSSSRRRLLLPMSLSYRQGV